jgi:tRNA A-37 threonylcarbamoyl transferase component Bud32
VADPSDRGEGQVRASTGTASAPAVEETDDEPATETPRRPISRPSIRRITRPSMLLDLQEGTPVGEYEIQAQIGEGAMGTVYSAVHPLIGKTVAVKVLKPELCANQASIDRFVQEAQAVNKIGHPNIVDVFSLGELPDGRAYMIMEWLRGEDLKTRLSRGPITVPDACDILDGIARALEAAHAKDIVHRDLKPDNVFLHQVENGPMMVKLLDFGIAKLMRTQTMEKTQTGRMLGTPAYISPEQARGIDVTHRSDIYSLGVMAYEMLAGRPPFEGESAMDLVVKHMGEEPPLLSLFAKLPKPLESCVMRMLEKDPAKRPALADVRQILVDPTRRSTLPSIEPPKPRRRGLKIAGGLVVVAGSAFAAWTIVTRETEREAAAPPPPVTAAAPAPAEPPKPAPAPAAAAEPALGKLEISVSGSKDAEIFVDGVERGRGSELKADVKPGPHTVEVRPPKGTPITRDIEVAEGATLGVEIDVPVSKPAGKPVGRPPVRPKPPVKPPLDDDELLRPKGRP